MIPEAKMTTSKPSITSRSDIEEERKDEKKKIEGKGRERRVIEKQSLKRKFLKKMKPQT